MSLSDIWTRAREALSALFPEKTTVWMPINSKEDESPDLVSRHMSATQNDDGTWDVGVYVRLLEDPVAMADIEHPRINLPILETVPAANCSTDEMIRIFETRYDETYVASVIDKDDPTAFPNVRRALIRERMASMPEMLPAMRVDTPSFNKQ